MVVRPPLLPRFVAQRVAPTNRGKGILRLRRRTFAGRHGRDRRMPQHRPADGFVAQSAFTRTTTLARLPLSTNRSLKKPLNPGRPTKTQPPWTKSSTPISLSVLENSVTVQTDFQETTNSRCFRILTCTFSRNRERAPRQNRII